MNVTDIFFWSRCRFAYSLILLISSLLLSQNSNIRVREDAMQTLKEILVDYLAAYNAHQVEKILSFLHPNCRVIYNGQVWVEGLDALKATYEKDFLNPNARATLREYRAEEADRLRVCLQTVDQRVIDVTYVFDLRDDSKKMIEHIIHSVESKAE